MWMETPEQVHRYPCPLSVSPLTWSHATFVMTVRENLEKWNTLVGEGAVVTLSIRGCRLIPQQPRIRGGCRDKESASPCQARVIVPPRETFKTPAALPSLMKTSTWPLLLINARGADGSPSL